MKRSLRFLMGATDVGFILYWSVVGLDLLPKEYGYNDYTNEYLVDWNLSFLPLDLAISITGLLCMYRYWRERDSWKPLCLMSLTLTSCSGLQAIAFWAIRGDLDWLWWTPNLFLLLYPVYYLADLIADRERPKKAVPGTGYIEGNGGSS